MIFAEDQARLLLVVHLVLGAALVASSTHLVVWLWRYPRGDFARHRGARRFALITASLFVANFLVGLTIYPVYKVRVRVEYLDNPTAIARDADNRATVRALIDERRGSPIAATPPADPDALPMHALARWFDVKEHAIALGLVLSLACAIILCAWEPRRDGDAIATAVFGFALFAAATTWFAALVGTLVTSYRSIGSL